MPQNTTKLPKASDLGLSAVERAELFTTKRQSRAEERRFRQRVAAFTAHELARLRLESAARSREASALEQWLQREACR